MSIRRQIDASLAQLTFAHREENYHHLSYEDDLHPYALLQQGDIVDIYLGGKFSEPGQRCQNIGTLCGSGNAVFSFYSSPDRNGGSLL